MEHRLAALCVALVTTVTLAASAVAQPVQLAIVDKVGTEVGPRDGATVFVRLDEETIVAIQVGPVTVEGGSGRVWQDGTRLIPTTTATVYFSEANCGGTTYLFYSAYSGLGAQPSGTVADLDGKATVYVAKPGYPVGRHLGSKLERGHVCKNGPYREFVVPVVKVFDLSARFQTPYTLR